MSRLYAVWCAAVLVLLAVVQWRGFSLLATEQQRGVPASVRNNPGAYRPIYVGGGRTLHGK